jgi:UDP-N-acetylglucosamine 2-epimerase
LVGNSSVGIRECSFLGVPVVNIGTRQHRRLRGKNVIDVDYNKNHITEAVLSQVKINRLPSERIYGSGESGKKIAEILATTDLKFHKTITY